MSLVARYLEAAGIPTIIIGSAIDIVTQCKVPRFLFVDFPLGNPCGKPGNGAMQQRIVSHGLQLLTRASSPETIEYSDESWGHDDWKSAYMEVSDHNRAALRKTGDELRTNRQVRQKRDFS